jgi:4'-phosphopantetheinyl transferase
MTAAPLVWLVDGRAVSDVALAGFMGWLSPGEMARHGAFSRRLRQRQFLIGRVLLRQLLGSLLGIPAASIRLLERRGEAPRLDRADSAGLGLSISHSGPWVACAANPHSLLGLDIEVLDPARDMHALAAQAFDAAENEWLGMRPASGRLRDFYNLWCAKEARFKLHSEKGECVHLFHDELAIAVCHEQPLDQLPLLQLRSLDAPPGG